MLRFLLNRLMAIPLALALVHFFGYAYASLGRWYQITQNPFFAGSLTPPPVLSEYADYIGQLVQLKSEKMPGGSVESIADAVLRTGRASLGLLAIAFATSLLLGLLLGLAAVRVKTHGVAGWLVPVSAVSLSMPSFYIGAVILSASLYYLFWAEPGAKLPFPLRGFGWDIHLVLPVTVLMLRPAMQIAQVTATGLAEELGRQYIVTARALGHTWRRVRWRTALKNALVPIVLAVGAAFRLLIVELILVEWLFGWPGLGRLLAETLFRPQTASMLNASVGLGTSFLYPPVVAAGLAVFALLFLLGDTLISVLIRLCDPRLLAHEPAGAQ